VRARAIRRGAAGALLPFLLAGCTFLQGRADIGRAVHKDLIGEAPVAISGRITSARPVAHSVVVVLLEEEGGRPTVSAHWVLHRPGTFSFLRPAGTYRLFAFVDENEDLAYQTTEPAGWYGAPSDVHARPGKPVEGLELALKPPRAQSAALRASTALAAGDLAARTNPRHAGDVTTLNDARFSSDVGKLGLWDPALFLERYGMGISFLQPYDPSKIPVVFVHGTSGYPQQFAYLASVLDGTRFQPWVFHYPSGQRLQAVADTLADVLEELRSTLRMPAAVVVAHSAGGLVARMALRQRDGDPRESVVKLLVTISTPWQGHAGAGRGLGRSPIVVPAWIDMAPGSKFLEALGASRLPAGLEYHLFFGYRGGETLTMRENSDGSVTLQSMLDRRAQAEAVRIHGFHEDHASILRSADVSRTLNQLLEETAARVRVPGRPATAAR
jgi:pimeloyl-ACP methyl ester carboxylesterase